MSLFCPTHWSKIILIKFELKVEFVMTKGSIKQGYQYFFIKAVLDMSYRAQYAPPHMIRVKCIAFHILPQLYIANHATFPIQMYAITV